MKKEFYIAIGADGKGSTFEEIVNATKDGRIKGKVVLLFSNNPNAPAVEKARASGIPILILDKRLTKETRDERLCLILKGHITKPDLICLAGYLKLIPSCLIEAFPKRIINSHPALDLLRFGGKGMYGRHVAEAVIKAGLKETGSTIHHVTEIYDDPQGIIAKTEPIPVFPEDSPESLLARQLPLEQKLYIEIIQRFSEEHRP